MHIHMYYFRRLQVTGPASPMPGVVGRPTTALRDSTSKCSKTRRCRMAMDQASYHRRTGSSCCAYRCYIFS